MPRPQLGTQARTEIISVRITAAQRKELERVYGKASDGLHALLTAWMATK
jgi:hypothetical protein